MTKAQPLQSYTETLSVSVGVIVVDHYIRCITPGCHKLLVTMATRPWKAYCRHCKTLNHGDSETC